MKNRKLTVDTLSSFNHPMGSTKENSHCEEEILESYSKIWEAIPIKNNAKISKSPHLQFS